MGRFDAESIRSRFTVEGMEHFERAKAQGKGVILVSGHLGAFDVGYFLASELGEVHFVGKMSENPWIAADFERLRTKQGLKMVPVRGAGWKMHRVLRAGGNVTFLWDQRTQPLHGILIPFLGQPAWTNTMPANLAATNGAPMLPMIGTPLGRGHYKVTILPPFQVRGKSQEDAVALTQEVMGWLSEEIRNRPDMWFWMHTRWQRCAWPDAGVMR